MEESLTKRTDGAVALEEAQGTDRCPEAARYLHSPACSFSTDSRGQRVA